MLVSLSFRAAEKRYQCRGGFFRYFF